MRVFIGIGGGLAVGLLFLIQALGMAHWCHPWLFTILHFPSAILVFALSQGEFVLGSPPSPYGVVLQWTFLGALVGVLLHLKQRPVASANVAKLPQQFEREAWAGLRVEDAPQGAVLRIKTGRYIAINGVVRKYLR